MYQTVDGVEEFQILIKKEPAVIAYFSTEGCSVCKVLKPKVGRMVMDSFPEIKLIYVDAGLQPGIAAKANVFVSPTIVAFFDGQECIRRSRAVDTLQFIHDLSRYYRILFH